MVEVSSCRELNFSCFSGIFFDVTILCNQKSSKLQNLKSLGSSSVFFGRVVHLAGAELLCHARDSFHVKCEVFDVKSSIHSLLTYKGDFMQSLM